MPWHLFGLVPRRKLEEAERELRYAVADRDLYQSRWHYTCRCLYEESGQIVRLRRELDSARNHVPLLGTVFDGEVL